MKQITYGEVFSGVGAANAAFGPLGWKNKYFIENKPTALLQYLFNWDDEFYGLVLSSYQKHKAANRSDRGIYKDLLEMAVNYESPEKQGDLYALNRMLSPAGWQFPQGTTDAYDRVQRDRHILALQTVINDLAVDVSMTSPPCQSFSQAGKRAGLEDKGDLFFETHKFLELTLPKVFILENVPGMLKLSEDSFYDDLAQEVAKSEGQFIYRYSTQGLLFPSYPSERQTFYDIILPSLGITANTTRYPLGIKIYVWREAEQRVVALNPLPYNLKFLIVGAPSFGSPMQRQRIFIVGFRNDINSSGFKFNIPSLKTESILNYINPDARRSNSFRYKEYKKGTYSFDLARGAKKIIDGGGLQYNKAAGAEPYIPTLLTKEDPRKIAIAKSDGNYRWFADEQLRNLMGFPPGFNSSIVSYSASLLHYGNSIYVPALNHIGRQIEKILKKNS